MKPEWIVYKNEQRIGQAITWHKALDVLIKQEPTDRYEIIHHGQIIFINPANRVYQYKIVKER